MRFRDLQKLIMSPTRPLHETGMVKLRDLDISFVIVRSARRTRTIAFTIDPNAGLRIMAPLRTRRSTIQAMLQHRAPWILAKLSEHQKAKEVNMPQDFVDGETFSYMGNNCRLRVTQSEAQPQGCRLKPRFLWINIADVNLSAEGLKQEVRLEILLWIKKRAKIKFKKRMDLWSKKLGVSYKKLLITDPARQWGSCTVDNIVRLNWRLMMAPLPLIDYVVAHELVHIIHKNHSSRFWGTLGKFMPDYQERRKKLRRIGSGLIL